ncbi:redox-sensitive transcriptional activator SoxR [Pseudomaricurvus sp. HS19]|uniref:redox-sensitive transcriptional activator SoxR n=1 Tax=Pseudomaricurvus sp. HS19 TaxID=2692626 RepID=UPI00136EA33F|nr:redox-sensitive transcriptional activator SoxR [Pseudomaricurvus sp. HS19]MYM61905.1 redox-sensitive transcriptional activator SoxR [Pseudomaricurvus sp. HS19]
MAGKKEAGVAARQMLSVGQIAERSGIPVSALHFYESKGLICSERNAGNQRRYPRYILRQLAIIRVAQSLGLSLAEIREQLATLPEKGPPTAEDWRRLSSQWSEDLETRIAKMVALRDKLTECIGCGCLTVEDCPLRNPDDQAAAGGPGARAFDPQ